MAAAAGALDEAIKEYLVYRGYTSTLKAFEQERKEDRDKGLRVRKAHEFLQARTFSLYILGTKICRRHYAVYKPL